MYGSTASAVGYASLIAYGMAKGIDEEVCEWACARMIHIGIPVPPWPEMRDQFLALCKAKQNAD